jgi:hypothetical protein
MLQMAMREKEGWKLPQATTSTTNNNHKNKAAEQ